MSYRLVLDENIEHEVVNRLETFGHDVEHVEFVDELGKGVDDRSIAQYSRDQQRIIVTYDADFTDDVDEDDYYVAIYFQDRTLSAKQTADIVENMSRYLPQSELDGLEYGNTDWLDVP